MKISSNFFAQLALALACAVLLAPCAATAAPIYDNGAPSAANGYGISGAVGNPGTDWTTIDDFTLSSNAAVTGVGFYFNNFNGIAGWDGRISYAIFADAGGAPATLLATGAGRNVQAVSGGYAWCCSSAGSELVTFDLQSGFAAVANHSYWLQLGGAGGPTPWWVTTGADGAGNGRSGGGAVYVDFAFYLTGADSGTDLPEPAAIALFGLGLAGLALGRRVRA